MFLNPLKPKQDLIAKRWGITHPYAVFLGLT